jgi:hypothetical protein
MGGSWNLPGYLDQFPFCQKKILKITENFFLNFGKKIFLKITEKFFFKFLKNFQNAKLLDLKICNENAKRFFLLLVGIEISSDYNWTDQTELAYSRYFR